MNHHIAELRATRTGSMDFVLDFQGASVYTSFHAYINPRPTTGNAKGMAQPGPVLAVETRPVSPAIFKSPPTASQNGCNGKIAYLSSKGPQLQEKLQE